jgi:two-component system CheB/CheR fusion protein
MASSPTTSDALPTPPDVVPSSLDFPVVGIGASAGGLPALLRFFESMPTMPGMAVVAILHLSPEHPSSATDILRRATRMPVIEVTGKVDIQSGHVYVIAPHLRLTMTDGILLVDDVERPRSHHVAIDLLFRTLAHTHRERAVAIVLSGTGSDGAVGIARVKERGGITLVQAPDDAEHAGMPAAAIRTGAVDFVLPVAEMARKVIDLWNNARIIRLPAAADQETVAEPINSPDELYHAETTLLEIIAELLSRTGHDFSHYKRATVLRRIERRMRVRQVHTLPAYHEVLASDEHEYTALLDDMLIGGTNFFRDGESFEVLERDIIPALFKDKKPGDEVRAWVAACATGEEAYSLAMLMADQAGLMEHPPAFQVFASDLDNHAIAKARAGTYPASIVTDVGPARLRQYFTEEDERYRARKSLRDHILFASHNLLRDPPFARIDMVSCRNLLIHLDGDVQVRLLQTFHFALKPGGFLFLGRAESAESVSAYFIAVDEKNRGGAGSPPG